MCPLWSGKIQICQELQKFHGHPMKKASKRLKMCIFGPKKVNIRSPGYMFGLKRWQKGVKNYESCTICVEITQNDQQALSPHHPGGGHVRTVFLRKPHVWTFGVKTSHLFWKCKMCDFGIKICRFISVIGSFMSNIAHLCPKLGPMGLEKLRGRPPKGPWWQQSLTLNPWGGGLGQIWSKFHN